MRNYELTVVLPGEATEAKQKAFTTKLNKLVESLGGRVVNTTLWGKRELFYPIQKNTSGVYYFLDVELPAEQAAVLNREIELDEEVIRHLLVLSSKSNKKQEAQSTNVEIIEEKEAVKLEKVTKTRKSKKDKA